MARYVCNEDKSTNTRTQSPRVSVNALGPTALTVTFDEHSTIPELFEKMSILCLVLIPNDEVSLLRARCLEVLRESTIIELGALVEQYKISSGKEMVAELSDRRKTRKRMEDRIKKKFKNGNKEKTKNGTFSSVWGLIICVYRVR